MSTNVQPSAPTPDSPTAEQPAVGKTTTAPTATFPTSALPQASTPRTPASPGSASANPEAAEGSQYPAPGSSLGTSPTTSTATAAVGPDDDGVWSASRPAADAPVPVSRSLRSGTVAWGVFLAALGGLLIAVGVGIHLDLAQITIGLVAGAGLLLVALAFLPRRKDEQA